MSLIDCPLCKGAKVVSNLRSVKMTFDLLGTKSPTAEHIDTKECPHCNGSGQVAEKPFGDGSKAQLSKEKMRELASAATLLGCLDSAVLVQAVANEAARIHLPEDVVETFVQYWKNPYRDVTLGHYIFQIAEASEELAMKIYGNLGERFIAMPRPSDKRKDE